MGILRPSCWTKDESNTIYATAFGYDHDADKAAGQSNQLIILLKGVLNPTNPSSTTWTVVDTTPKASLTYPSVEECTVGPTGVFTSLQRYDNEKTGNNTEIKLLGGFQYSPTPGQEGGTWSTILAGLMHVDAHFIIFSVPASVGSTEHAVVYARANRRGFNFSILHPGETSFQPVAQNWTWYRHLYRFNGDTYEPTIDIDLRAAPEAFTGLLGSNGQPMLLVSTNDSDKIGMFSYTGRREDIPLPSVAQNFFSYPLDSAGKDKPSSPNDNPGLSGGAIAGVVVGALVATVCAAFFVVLYFKRKKSRSATMDVSNTGAEQMQEEHDDVLHKPDRRQPQQTVESHIPDAASDSKIPHEESLLQPVAYEPAEKPQSLPLGTISPSRLDHISESLAQLSKPQSPHTLPKAQPASLDTPNEARRAPQVC
ncbi:hypothetical protein BGZ73_006438 [Actinomortierella ambigua]|nr:hypothetical protein BGZ73_006438 [Actinomortierella ambigua]